MGKNDEKNGEIQYENVIVMMIVTIIIGTEKKRLIMLVDGNWIDVHVVIEVEVENVGI